ncbi:MAG TPA: nitrous oxide reductase family maturation protein NosD [Anaerolineae bacterium]|nr:nitrous oxide reductase family maturation protein NosD [Anaerolineae bacterium]
MKQTSLILLLNFIVAACLAGSAASAQENGFDLQAAIDAAAPGAVIDVPPGVYRQNLVIAKPITLAGLDWPVIDGGNQGNVIEINQAPDVTIRGLVIRNSGSRLDQENAGIAVDQSPGLTAENNRLENTLFGIYIKDSADSRIIGNTIGAKDLDVPARGDGIRVWYSYNTEVSGNRVDRGRDVVLWYNNGAVIRDNVISNGRYGLHFMYCDDNVVEHNTIEGNSVGAFLMYSRRLALRHNIFAHNRGPSGYGIGLKDMDGVEAVDNLFSGNRVGMYFDNSPWSVDVSQHFTRNAFVYNDIGLLFTPAVKRNQFSHNSFIDNLEQVGLTGSGTFEKNDFTVDGAGNFWSDYTGYDTTGDGLGDLPYVSKSLFENMMDSHPQLRLFQLSPAQQAVDLAARAFPIFQPKPKFTDDAPLMEPVIPAVNPPTAGSNRAIWAVAGGLLLAGGLVIAAGRRALKGDRPPYRPPQPAVTRPALPVKDTPMITVTPLTKTFGNFTAVDDLSFEVAPGEAVALWGANGAGKTTVIRSLLGLLSARGELRVNGFDARRQGKQARAAVGYVPQELAFYDDLSARETLLFYARLKHIAAHRVDEVLNEVGLSAHGHKIVAALSGGMKQRLALASALLADPPLLVLDEPTSNLDTTARDEFIKLLLAQKQRGKTLLFTSHRLEEVELLASRVLVLEDGRLKLICDRPAELAGRLGMTLSLKLIIPSLLQEEALRLLEAQGFPASRNGVGLRVNVLPSAKLAPLRLLLERRIEVNNFEIENGV